MLRFSNSNGSDLSRVKSPDLQPRGGIPEELQPLIHQFINSLLQHPAYGLMKSLGMQAEMEEQVKAVILKEAELAPKKFTEIRAEFAQGKYDQFIFGKTPQVTSELTTLISQSNREFMTRLFTKCRSVEQLTFWVNQGKAQLPEDSLALVVALGNNLHALQYLKEQGKLADLSEEDKKQLLVRASRFKNEGYAFLQREFNDASPVQHSTLTH